MTCIICGKPAKHRFSPDLDIKGLGACNKHLKDVNLAYIMLITDMEKDFWKMIKTHKDYKKV